MPTRFGSALLVLWGVLVPFSSAKALEITEAQYEGRPQFVIQTDSATWFYDRAGGGFSRLLDREGRDWIAFHKEPLEKFPASAAAGYRGLPNAVFSGPDQGAGHPGFDRCVSERLGSNAIRSVSKTGRWAWTWAFSETQARFKMERVDGSHAWWFLYEGPVAGSFAPNRQYWGTDQGGPRSDAPDIKNQLFDRWRWIYFGDQQVPRVFFILQHQPDDLLDTLWYLGATQGGEVISPDGMMVFGFGRGRNTKALFTRAGLEFTVGFLEQKVSHPADHDRVADRIQSMLTPKPDAASLSWEAPPERQTCGQFWRYHWYERGLSNANPAYEARFRINSPEVVLHPQFGRRTEARENGLMLIKAEEDLFQLTGAELYLEMWGGHPGTANKRVMVNGRGLYRLPQVGTEEGHCTYFYPTVPLKIHDLVNGYDAFQFALDQGTTFWGHALIDNAALRVALTNRHSDLVRLGLAEFQAEVKAESLRGQEGFALKLEVAAEALPLIASVDFQGWYEGYDENGNLKPLDWHGFTKQRLPTATLGWVTDPPFEINWDTSMLPAQKQVAVRAVIRFRADPNLVFVTAATRRLEIAERERAKVIFLAPHDLPAPFWSRAGRKRTCSFELDFQPEHLERAELHIVTWTGGSGSIKEYFKLNGVHYPVAEGARHELLYCRLPVEVKNLRRGRNLVELLSDTEHHGIEVIFPGPVLAVRRGMTN